MKKARKQTVQRVMTPEELVNLLLRHGWGIEEMTGSHCTMSKPGEWDVITIPMHKKTLGKGLLHELLRRAHLI